MSLKLCRHHSNKLPTAQWIDSSNFQTLSITYNVALLFSQFARLIQVSYAVVQSFKKFIRKKDRKTLKQMVLHLYRKIILTTAKIVMKSYNMWLLKTMQPITKKLIWVAPFFASHSVKMYMYKFKKSTIQSTQWSNGVHGCKFDSFINFGL